MSEDFIDIRVLAQTIRRWWLLLLLGPVIGGIAALGVHLGFPETPEIITTPNIYEASTIVRMDDTGLLGGVAELVTTKPILEAAISDLGLSTTVAELRPNVSAIRIKESLLIRITVSDTDQSAAIELADGIARSFINYVIAFQEPQLAAAQDELSRKLTELQLDRSNGAFQELVGRLNSSVKRPVVITPAEAINVPMSEVLVQPSGSNATRNLLIGVFLGVVLSTLFVFLLEYFRKPVGSPDQFESRFSLARMGTLPKSPKRRNQSLTLPVADESTPAAMETIRQLATSVALTIQERQINTLAIVSLETRDGRSNLTANLGVALAGGWKNVVLVDADLRCPTLHNYFNADNTTGLSDFLANPDLEVTQILQETRYNRLKIIPSGPLAANPVELLSSPRMRWLLEHLKETTDVVLLDTPPLMAVTDGVVVSNQVGGVILLVNGPNNGTDDMKAAVANLERAGTPILGYVWNAMTSGLAGKSPQSRQYYRRFTNLSFPGTKMGSEPLGAGVESYSNGARVGEAPRTR